MGERKSTKVILRDDMLFVGYSSNGYTIPIDAAHREVGGHNAGIAPMELLLTALAGCTGMDVISILRKKQQKISAFEVQVEGVRGEEHPKVYTEIWVKFLLAGQEIDPNAVERAIALSREKYCGAAATLRHTATLHYSYEIVEAEPESEA